jgi:hypothetical protein
VKKTLSKSPCNGTQTGNRTGTDERTRTGHRHGDQWSCSASVGTASRKHRRIHAEKTRSENGRGEVLSVLASHKHSFYRESTGIRQEGAAVPEEVFGVSAAEPLLPLGMNVLLDDTGLTQETARQAISAPLKHPRDVGTVCRIRTTSQFGVQSNQSEEAQLNVYLNCRATMVRVSHIVADPPHEPHVYPHVQRSSLHSCRIGLRLAITTRPPFFWFLVFFRELVWVSFPLSSTSCRLRAKICCQCPPGYMCVAVQMGGDDVQSSCLRGVWPERSRRKACA